MLLAHLKWQVFGAGLGQTIRERLQQDRVVIVVCSFELANFLVDADAGSNGERTDVIPDAGRRDEIRKTAISLLTRFLPLLPQM